MSKPNFFGMSNGSERRNLKAYYFAKTYGVNTDTVYQNTLRTIDRWFKNNG